jgi:hypothetical protein
MDRRTGAALRRAGYPEHPHVAHQIRPRGGAGRPDGGPGPRPPADAPQPRDRPVPPRCSCARSTRPPARRPTYRIRTTATTPSSTTAWMITRRLPRPRDSPSGFALGRRALPLSVANWSCDIVPTWSHEGSDGGAASLQRSGSTPRRLPDLPRLLLRRGPKTAPRQTPDGPRTSRSRPTRPLNPDWRGDGKAVTLAFGGDVHFEGAVGVRLTAGPGDRSREHREPAPGGLQLRMVNLESALTDGTCPQPQDKPYIFYAPPTALTALRDATVTVISRPTTMGRLRADRPGARAGGGQERQLPRGGSGGRRGAGLRPVPGHDRRAAHRHHRGHPGDRRQSDQHLDGHVESGGRGLRARSDQLIRAVQAARRTSDTVVVYLHWGTETVACPNPQQEPLAEQLVKAGADIVVGTGAHVLLGAGYLGTPTSTTGSATSPSTTTPRPRPTAGRSSSRWRGVTSSRATFRPATIVAGTPPTPYRHPGRRGHAELGRRPQLHQPFGHPDGQPGLREGGDDSLRAPRPPPRRRPDDCHDGHCDRWVDDDDYCDRSGRPRRRLPPSPRSRNRRTTRADRQCRLTDSAD